MQVIRQHNLARTERLKPAAIAAMLAATGLVFFSPMASAQVGQSQLGLPSAERPSTSELLGNEPSGSGMSDRLPPFSFVDQDGDRVISRDEAASEPLVSRAFSRMDQDNDREITRSEYLRSMRRSQAESAGKFGRVDTPKLPTQRKVPSL